MERTITHLRPRLDTVRGVVIGWQGRVTLRLDGYEAMNIIECQLDQHAWRPLDTWTQCQAMDALAAALDAPQGQPAALMSQLVRTLQGRVRYPLLEHFSFPEG